MTAKTPEGKRVRRVFMSASTPSGVVTNDDVVTHQWEDDVRVIGVSIIHEAYIVDANMNEDEQVQLITEVTASGQWAQPGCLFRAELQAIWTGVIHSGDATRRETHIMFPEGYGVDFDEHEFINMMYSFQKVCTVANYSFHNAIVYYVER